jgi:hypothetical protein
VEILNMLGRRSEAIVDIDGPWRDRAMMATIGLTIQPLDMTKDGALSLRYDITLAWEAIWIWNNSCATNFFPVTNRP